MTRETIIEFDLTDDEVCRIRQEVAHAARHFPDPADPAQYDDHRFIDSAANTVSGKQACLDAWRGFFGSFPDYRNIFTSLTAKDDMVTIVGCSECAEPSLAGPALWTAKIQGEAVTEWRVYLDTPEVRASLGVCGTP